MTIISALQSVHVKGFFGDYEDKDENELLKLSESKDFLIIQIVKYKKSSISINKMTIDNLNFNNEALNVNGNNIIHTRSHLKNAREKGGIFSIKATLPTLKLPAQNNVARTSIM